MLPRFLTLLPLVLCLTPSAHAARAYSKPRPEVASEPELVAALPAAVRDGLKETEYGSWKLGAEVVVGADWRIERGSSGVTVGRSKEVDALARASAKNCYVLHLRVRQDFDGQNYVNSYRVFRALATVDGTEADRHALDCAAFTGG